jgi:hypothetical protein
MGLGRGCAKEGNRLVKQHDKVCDSNGCRLYRLDWVKLEDPLTGLRVVRGDILRNLKLKSKGFEVEVELNPQLMKQGYSIIDVSIKYRVRIGKKELKVRHGTTFLKSILLGKDNFF